MIFLVLFYSLLGTIQTLYVFISYSYISLRDQSIAISICLSGLCFGYIIYSFIPLCYSQQLPFNIFLYRQDFYD